MKSQKMISLLLAGVMLLVSLTACSAGQAAVVKPTASPEPVQQKAVSPTDDPGKIETTIVPDSIKTTEAPKETLKFPLPKNPKIFSNTDSMVIASVKMKMDEVIAYYRAYAKDKGLTENELLTTITDNVFSIVFRVPNQEEELVVQGTVMDADNITLSVRYEETDKK